jgi:Rod binding domain-containing protein
MDIANLMPTSAVSPLVQLENTKGMASASEAQKEKFAKDFESVFISKLLDEMKNTIGDWGLEKDSVTEQVNGIFWLYLSQDMANNGGFGMWKDIKQSLDNSEQKNTSTEMLDTNL